MSVFLKVLVPEGVTYINTDSIVYFTKNVNVKVDLITFAFNKGGQISMCDTLDSLDELLAQLQHKRCNFIPVHQDSDSTPNTLYLNVQFIDSFHVDDKSGTCIIVSKAITGLSPYFHSDYTVNELLEIL